MTDIDVNQTKKGGDGDAREKRTANLLVFDEDTREERAKMSKTTDKGRKSECALTTTSSSPPSEKKKNTPTSATTHAKADTEEEEEE